MLALKVVRDRGRRKGRRSGRDAVRDEVRDSLRANGSVMTLDMKSSEDCRAGYGICVDAQQ